MAKAKRTARKKSAKKPVSFEESLAGTIFEMNVEFEDDKPLSVRLVGGKPMDDEIKAFLVDPRAKPLLEFIASMRFEFVRGEPRIVEWLASKRDSAQLRNLALESYDQGDGWLQEAPLGKLGRLWPKLANLESLYLRGCSRPIENAENAYFGCHTEIGGLSLPKLQKYFRRASDLTVDELSQVGAANLPALSELTLILGPQSNVRAAHVDVLAPLAKRLSRLLIGRTTKTADFLEALAETELAGKLIALSLAGGDLTEADVPLVWKCAKKFSAVRAVDFSDNALSAGALQELKAAFPKLHALRQRSSPDEIFYQDKIYQEARRIG